MQKPVLDEEMKAALAPELKALEEIWFAKGVKAGKGEAGSGSAVIATAEKMADRAAELQVANPRLSSAEAVKRAYEEAGIPLE